MDKASGVTVPLKDVAESPARASKGKRARGSVPASPVSQSDARQQVEKASLGRIEEVRSHRSSLSRSTPQEKDMRFLDSAIRPLARVSGMGQVDELRLSFDRLGFGEPPEAFQANACSAVQDVIQKLRPGQGIYVTRTSLKRMEVRILRKESAQRLETHIRSKAGEGDPSASPGKLLHKWLSVEGIDDWKGTRLDPRSYKDQLLGDTVDSMKAALLSSLSRDYVEFVGASPMRMLDLMNFIEDPSSPVPTANLLFGTANSRTEKLLLHFMNGASGLPAETSKRAAGDALRMILDAWRGQLIPFTGTEFSGIAARIADEPDGAEELHRFASDGLSKLPQSHQMFLRRLLDFLAALDGLDSRACVIEKFLATASDYHSSASAEAVHYLIRNRERLLPTAADDTRLRALLQQQPIPFTPPATLA